MKAINENIATEATTNMVNVRWSCDWHRADRNRPYLAVISRGENRLSYNFINSFDKENSSPKSACHAAFNGKLEAGIVLKARTGGSVKNEYLYYYVVDASADNGIREIEYTEAMELLV